MEMQKKNVERITGIDLVLHLLDFGNKEHKTVYLFGSKKEVINDLIAVCKVKYSNLEIVGAIHGYVSDRNIIKNDIIEKQPDILLVALGTPLQEEFIWDCWQGLTKSFCVGVGGSFDVISGKVQRAPDFYIKHNLEWLYRISREPIRLNRFIRNTVGFMVRLLKE